MKLLCKPYRPVEGTWQYKAVQFFVNHINWCEGYFYNTDKPKPDNKIYNFFYTYWLFPFEQNDCICCNTVRGVLYGIILGVLLCQ